MVSCSDRAIEQRLRFGGGTFISLLAVTISVVLLSSIIGYFTAKERAHDLLERKRSAQVVSFSVFK